MTSPLRTPEDAENWREFVLEEADEFEKEVAWLSGSAKFVDFLKARAEEPAIISIDDLEKERGFKGD